MEPQNSIIKFESKSKKFCNVLKAFEFERVVTHHQQETSNRRKLDHKKRHQAGGERVTSGVQGSIAPELLPLLSLFAFLRTQSPSCREAFPML